MLEVRKALLLNHHHARYLAAGVAHEPMSLHVAGRLAGNPKIFSRNSGTFAPVLRSDSLTTSGFAGQ